MSNNECRISNVEGNAEMQNAECGIRNTNAESKQGTRNKECLMLNIEGNAELNIEGNAEKAKKYKLKFRRVGPFRAALGRVRERRKRNEEMQNAECECRMQTRNKEQGMSNVEH